MLASTLSASSDPSVEYVPHSSPSKPYWLAEAGEKHEKYTNFRSTEALPESAQVVIIGASLYPSSLSSLQFYTIDTKLRRLVVLIRGLALYKFSLSSFVPFSQF